MLPIVIQHTGTIIDHPKTSTSIETSSMMTSPFEQPSPHQSSFGGASEDFHLVEHSPSTLGGNHVQYLDASSHYFDCPTPHQIFMNDWQAFKECPPTFDDSSPGSEYPPSEYSTPSFHKIQQNRKNGQSRAQSSSSTERRREQNRSSQRAFRDREKFLREGLRARVEELEKIQNEISSSYDTMKAELATAREVIERLQKEKEGQEKKCDAMFMLKASQDCICSRSQRQAGQFYDPNLDLSDFCRTM
ncbi:hypothetical protein BKA61DRAFT_736614 [Leptodontidium sp. MPI-SDFR-AT-0119]|nr:hypothetical protein BKA61DRAFT_660781 [Leptodontidium sp. MPI-SDFR-AT-0119]KAH6712124.1 hypothetical protein BKA61DRAFT_736614 [Leptodontidium sp. MPI-SDFR-AT-0119]